MVYAEGGWAEQAPQFAFYFMSKKGFDNYRRQGKLPLRMRVYIKDFFQWTFEDRMKTRDYYTDWTKEDEERYGNLIITAIRVAGEYELCDDVPIAETLVPLAVTSQHNIITGFSYLFF